MIMAGDTMQVVEDSGVRYARIQVRWIIMAADMAA